jgi:hypothetical protein
MSVFTYSGKPSSNVNKPTLLEYATINFTNDTFVHDNLDTSRDRRYVPENFPAYITTMPDKCYRKLNPTRVAAARKNMRAADGI